MRRECEQYQTICTWASDTLNAANLKHGLVSPVTKSGTIDRYWCRCTAVQSPPNYTIRLESVSGGAPSGTLLSAGAEATFTPTTGVLTGALTTPAVIDKASTRLIAAVLAHSSGTIGASNNASFVTRITANGAPLQTLFPYRGTPYKGTATDDVWGNGSLDTICGYGLLYDDGTPVEFFMPLQELGSSTLSGTDQTGNIFKPDANFSAEQIRLFGRLDGSFRIKVYDANNAVLINQLVDAGLYYPGETCNVVSLEHPVQIVAGAVYRLVLEYVSGSVIIRNVEFSSGPDRDKSFGSYYETSSTDGVAWTDDDTKVTQMFLEGAIPGYSSQKDIDAVYAEVAANTQQLQKVSESQDRLNAYRFGLLDTFSEESPPVELQSHVPDYAMIAGGWQRWNGAGTLDVQAGNYVLVSADDFTAGKNVYTHDVGTPDYSYKLKIQCPDRIEARVFFRAVQSPLANYTLQFYPTTNPGQSSLRIIKFADDTETTLAEVTTLSITPDTWHDVTITVEGQSVTVMIDAIPASKLTATIDANMDSQWIGIGGGRAGAKFDELSAVPLESLSGLYLLQQELIEGNDNNYAAIWASNDIITGILGTPANGTIADDIAAIPTGDNSDVLAVLGTPANATVSADIAALDAVVDAGFAAGAKDATVAKEATLSAHDTSIDGQLSTLQTSVDAISNSDVLAVLGTPAGADMSADIAAVKTSSDEIQYVQRANSTLNRGEAARWSSVVVSATVLDVTQAKIV